MRNPTLKDKDKGQTAPKRTDDQTPINELPQICPVFDRKKLLEITGTLIQETQERVTGDRFRTRDGDRERLAYLRALRELIALHSALLKDAYAPPLEGYEGVEINLEEVFGLQCR